MASNRATLYDAGHYRCQVCGDNFKRVVYLGAVDLWLCGNCALDQLVDDALIVVGLERPTCSNCGNEANEFYCEDCWNEADERNLERDEACEGCGYDGTTWTYCHDCLGDRANEARCDNCGEPVTESYCTIHSEICCSKCERLPDYNFCQQHLDDYVEQRGGLTPMSGHDKATLRAIVIDSFTNSKPRISEDGTEVHDGDIIVRWEG